jgi:hypothetical protein
MLSRRRGWYCATKEEGETHMRLHASTWLSGGYNVRLGTLKLSLALDADKDGLDRLSSRIAFSWVDMSDKLHAPASLWWGEHAGTHRIKAGWCSGRTEVVTLLRIETRSSSLNSVLYCLSCLSYLYIVFSCAEELVFLIWQWTATSAAVPGGE